MTTERPASKNIWRDQLRADRKAAGLCTDCGEKAAPDLTRCRRCANRTNELAAVSRKKHPTVYAPKPCKGCKQAFTPKSKGQMYHDHDCFIRYGKPWLQRRSSVHTSCSSAVYTQRVRDAGQCPCARCMDQRLMPKGDRAAFIAKVAAEMGVPVSTAAPVARPQTQAEEMEAFERFHAKQRAARLRELKATVILDYPVQEVGR